MNRVVVIGSGFAGLSAACHLAAEGMKVTVVEKNPEHGGRARSFSAGGFTFDMGPSWYWMPDVFERFFARFSQRPEDYYQLLRLDPSYKLFKEDREWDVPADFTALCAMFEGIEAGSSEKLKKFLHEAGIKYRIAMEKLVYMPGLSIVELLKKEIVGSIAKLDIFQSMHQHLRKFFSDPVLLQLMEFPVLFLGALARDTPALYSLMNYADMKLGTWYPIGGIARVADAMYRFALALGVEFRFGESVDSIIVEHGRVSGIRSGKHTQSCDYLVAACDYRHGETLLPGNYRNYTERYWSKRRMSPSSLLYYIGIAGEIEGLRHHNLFFDAPFDQHAHRLYNEPAWPENPLMYVCCPSKTDKTVAPEGCENLFVLIPVAPGLNDSEEIREQYFNLAIERIERKTGVGIRDSIVYKRSYAGSDFIADYNAYKGNAYGLANTLSQTAILKPSIRNKKLRNMYYAGQLTVPGPGVPPAIISGEIVAGQILKRININEAAL
jgi:phytoene desaturase